MTTTTGNFANVPHPAGAVRICDWSDLQYDDPHRYWRGSSWVIEAGDRLDADVQVFIDGIQHGDGRIERVLHVHTLHADDELNIAQTRQLARALIAAADEAETMNG